MGNRQLVPRLLGAIVVALLAVAVTGRAAGPPIVINEVLAGNASTNLDPDLTNFSSWVELRNTGSQAINLAGLRLVSLRDGQTTPQSYTLPSRIVPAGGFVLVWYDESSRGGLHTPFELDMDGGWIELRTAAGELLDNVTLGEQEPDVSYGRAGDEWGFLDPPTPGAANSSPSFAAVAYAAAPGVSVAGGRHDGPQTVELTTTEPGGVIRYTLNGTKPTAASPVYTAPLAITATQVLRARTFAVGKITSPTVTHTYLIDVPANLPAVSIAIDPAHLFDDHIGIHVVGRNGANHCGKWANWHQPWERPASFEVYDTDGSRLVGQDVGFEIHGNCSRNMTMKSFEVIARKTYGDNDIDYPFFDDRPLLAYRRLILRTGGQDSTNTMLHDALSSEMISGRMNIERTAYRPIVVYINGAFWGVYALREKADESHIEHHYDLDEDTEFDFLEKKGVVMAGSAARWKQFYATIKKQNPALPSVYAQLAVEMDMEAYIDYQIAEIYAANNNWPESNVRFWRAYAPESRWRWVFHDVDLGFGKDMAAGHTQNTLAQAMLRKGPRGYHGFILNQLSRNATFRALFAQRFAAHLNTTFAPPRMTTLIDSLATAIAPDMPAQVARWGMPSSMARWYAELARLRGFVARRPDPMRGHLDAYLRHPGTAALTTTVNGSGDVLVAGVAVPDSYSGPHFRQTPFSLRAVAEPGHRFVHWQETGQTTAEIVVTLNGPATYNAVFEAEPPPPPLPAIVINEIHYRPNPESDEPDREFLELYHAGATLADLSGYSISAIGFTFPDGAVVEPGEYVVVAANGADPAYAALDADDVFDWAWADDDGHKLSNNSELVTLLHSDGRVVDSVTYDDESPWPEEPDGDGPSLALLAEGLDNSLPQSWGPSLEHSGTPGAVNFP